jgi:sulfite exporter TauE/SafE
MPCEDKAIFCFWSFGISKDWKQSMLTLLLYGMGLMTANVVIGTIISLISFPIWFIDVDNFVYNFFGALISIFVSVVMLIYVVSHHYNPHSRHVDEYQMEIDWSKKRTPYIFGILAGSPPCVFEILIYAQVFTYTVSYGIPGGLLTILFFSIGTVLGLFQLEIIRQYGLKKIPSTKSRSNLISIIMLVFIIFINVVLLIMAFFQIDVFPYDFLD